MMPSMNKRRHSDILQRILHIYLITGYAVAAASPQFAAAAIYSRIMMGTLWKHDKTQGMKRRISTSMVPPIPPGPPPLLPGTITV
jgi:hypothetical protein